ncbi:hypothetical protein TWF718_001828 [Orbilia javanica]|uniref:Uncharacterized protein n=1 Tax=Orbilia javanica TaxID=47235 RepID=A0AAN8NEG3_9PEZI
MPANKPSPILIIPVEIIFRIFNELDNLVEQRIYSYPKATVLGRPRIRVDPNRRSVSIFDALSRCCKRLRILCIPYLFRYLKVNVAEERTAIAMLQVYLNSHWVFWYTRRVRFVMDIRAIIVAELPMSVMRPNLNLLMNMIARLFQHLERVEELHFIVKSEIVSNGLRRVFRWPGRHLETSLRNVRSLKFSAGSEWIIRLCGGGFGLQEIENSPGLSGRMYVPYSIDFAREHSGLEIPVENLSARTALSRIGDYRAANIMKGISSLHKDPKGLTLTKVTVYGKFTRDGLDVFIKCIPAVSYLTIIGGAIEPDYALILSQLSNLRLLSFESGLDHSLENFQDCPESSCTLWHFSRFVRTLQQMWIEARFVGEIVRDGRGEVFPELTKWRDIWANILFRDLGPGDVEMAGN